MKVNRQAICDVLNKKALLDWHKERIEHWKQFRKTFKDGSHSLNEICEVRIDTHQVAINLIQSGAFDADPTEVQRLRAALDGIRQYLMLIPNKTVSEQRTIEICNEALSTTTEPAGAERVRECPDCGYDLKPGLRDSLECAKCGYSGNPIKKRSSGINAPKGDGNDA